MSTLVRFLGVELVGELTAQGRSADILTGNNVLHKVPALNDSVRKSNLLINAGFFALRQEMFDPHRLINFVCRAAPQPACDIHAGSTVGLLIQPGKQLSRHRLATSARTGSCTVTSTTPSGAWTRSRSGSS